MAGWDDVPDASATPKASAKGWDAVPDSAPANSDKPDPSLLDRAKGWVKGKVAESETRRQEMIKNPGKSILRSFGDISMVGIPGVQTLAGVTKGLADTAIAPAQLVAHAMGSKAIDPVANWVDSAYRTNFEPNMTGEMTGQMIPMAVSALGSVPQAASKALTTAQKVRAALAGITKASVTGAAASAGLSPEVNVQSEEDFWHRKADKAVTGAEIGGALGTAATVAPGLLRSGGQLWRRAIGKPAEREAMLLRAQTMRDATASAEFPQGAEPTLGEVMQSPNLKRVENAVEYVPGSGRGAQLEAQNQALAASVKDRAASAAPNLGPAGGGTEISASAQRGLAAKREPAIQLFNEVREGVGNAKPSTANTVAAYNEAIKVESGISGPGSPAVKALELERDNLAKGATGQTYESLEKIQDRLQSHASAGSQSADQVAQDIAAYKSKISKSVSKDLRATADAVDPSGNLGNKYAQANKIYSDSYKFDPSASGDWQGSKVKSANRILHGQDEFQGKIPESLFKGDDADMARHAYEALDAQGREAVKASILDRVQQAMKNPKGQTMSPKQASSTILDHQNFIKQFFGPSGRMELQGLGKALSEMQRSGQYMEALTTGKFTPALTATTELGIGALAAVQGHPAVLAGTGAATGAARLFTMLTGTKAGKDWLLKVSSAPSGSRVMQNLMADLPKVVRVPSNVVPLQTMPKAAETQNTDQQAQN